MNQMGKIKALNDHKLEVKLIVYRFFIIWRRRYGMSIEQSAISPAVLPAVVPIRFRFGLSAILMLMVLIAFGLLSTPIPAPMPATAAPDHFSSARAMTKLRQI